MVDAVCTFSIKTVRARFYCAGQQLASILVLGEVLPETRIHVRSLRAYVREGFCLEGLMIPNPTPTNDWGFVGLDTVHYSDHDIFTKFHAK